MTTRRAAIAGLAALAVTPSAMALQSLRPARLLVVRRLANVPSNQCVAPCIRGSVYDVTDLTGTIIPAAIVASGRTPVCDVIERAWANNAPDVSSVPKGVYSAKVRTDPTKDWMFQTLSRAWRIELAGVPGGRSAIQFHYGLDESWSQGCFIVGRLLNQSGNIDGNYCKVEAADAALLALRTTLELPGRDATRIEVTVADNADLFPSSRSGC